MCVGASITTMAGRSSPLPCFPLTLASLSSTAAFRETGSGLMPHARTLGKSGLSRFDDVQAGAEEKLRQLDRGHRRHAAVDTVTPHRAW